MKLQIKFGALLHAVDLMEPSQKGQFHLEYRQTSIEKIDIELATGKDVELKDVDVTSGLLSYKGRQVLLYIKDHGQSVYSAMASPGTGRRYHVADCATLKGMREQGRFERYVATNDTSGEFLISGFGIEGKARLQVCQNCLCALNYKGWSTGAYRNQILYQFNMAEFFATYSSFFPHMPLRNVQDMQTGYCDDWSKISSHYRVEKGFSCEECGVNLKAHRPLLHVHHINGVKSDNKPKNLRALCIDCHSKQPMHQHMVLSHNERQLINQLRNEQGLLNDLNGWNELFAYADPGVHGVLHLCQKLNLALPDVAHYLSDGLDGLGARLELAWTKKRFGIAISPADIQDGIKAGWDVVSVADFLENYRFRIGYLRN
ncbi:HNH endonuclease [Shewanella bicestrii]|uniref:HNH endonuclease n=1 Tax=Shewanella bicestrii TaxID=2018305 RepID=A0A220UN95_9GAMM|nr:HNH endonuclease signature motif containing protein [Shewanella bicestrii]ASK69470.1 HNH endonuclease [Shewanella bicestrii]